MRSFLIVKSLKVKNAQSVLVDPSTGSGQALGVCGTLRVKHFLVVEQVVDGSSFAHRVETLSRHTRHYPAENMRGLRKVLGGNKLGSRDRGQNVDCPEQNQIIDMPDDCR